MRYVVMIKFYDHLNYQQWGECATQTDLWDYVEMLKEKYKEEIEDIQVIKEY